MNQWFKIALLSALPAVGSAHTISPFILPEVFDTSASQNVSFQSSLTLEKFFVPSINFKTSYLLTDPKGQQIKMNPAAELKRFNVAEFDLPSEGTYRIRTDNALGNSSKYALIDGRWLRIRPVRPQNVNMQAPKPEQQKADAEKKPVTPPQPPRSVSADQVPANTQILEVKNNIIAESFVTKGKPSPVPAVSNKGFEVKFSTHPNELFAGESLKAQILLNGKAVPNLEVDVFKGASSYETSAQREQPHVKTNAKGEVEVKFEKPGIYLITTSYPEANPDNSKKPESEIFTYGLTVEVAE
jgi:type IV secretory pathway VirB10-like protein